MESTDDDETQLERMLAQLEIHKKSQTNNLKQTRFELSFDVKPHDLIIKRSFIYVGAFNSCVVYGLRIDNCIIINCSFEDCTLENVTLSNCVLQNTHFVECNLSSVIWQNLKKEDETIRGQDWQDDTMLVHQQPSEISDPSWLGGLISLNDPTTDWKLVSEKMSAGEGGPSEDVEAAFPSSAASSRKAQHILATSPPSNSPNVARDEYVTTETDALLQDSREEPPPLAIPKPFTTITKAACKKWYKEKYQWGLRMSNEAKNIARRPGRKAFPFMHLPADLRSKVYHLLLHPKELVIIDRPRNYGGPAAPAGQLRYKLWNDFGGRNRSWWSTYLATSSAGEDYNTTIQTANLRTSKRVHNEAMPVLYNRKIDLDCSAEGALSWLHDTGTNLSRITQLTFTYRLKDMTMPGPHNSFVELTRTHFWAFRHLINAIVHKCDRLHYFGFRVDKHFWKGVTYSKEGVTEVLESNYREYLRQVARLAHYDAKAAHRQEENNGVHVQFHVDNSQELSEERAEFLDDLECAIQMKRAERPRFAYSRPCNGCKAKTYDECCFAKLPANERTGG